MTIEKFADEFGPEKIFEVREPAAGLLGFVVIDNTARGVAKGGIRMTENVTVEEVARLARAMTWKTAMAELPFGGGKAGIVADGRTLTPDKKKLLMQAFGRALRGICPSEYVAGPDIGTNEQDMEEFARGNGLWQASTGKPTHVCKEPGICGLPHELGSTGYGVAQAVAVAVEHAGINLRNATVAVEGFGNVGEFAARYLTQMGARLVAISDSRGCIYADNIDFEKLWQIKKTTGSVTNYPNAEIIAHEKIFELPVQILVPAALPDVITAENVNRVRTKIIVEGSNIPITEAAEQNLHERGVVVVPDFVANAGGVISSYAEYEGKPLNHMFDLVKDKITANVKKILEEAKKRNVKPRDVALAIAKDRVIKAMKKSR